MVLEGAVLKPAPNASDFTIYHVDEDGKPSEVYDPKNGISTCVINSINISRQMLKTDTVKTALIQQATEYFKERPDAWFSGQGPAESEEKMESLTNIFFGKVLARFPSVLVDDSLHKRMVLALHWRYQWAGEFEISHQYISLDGKNLRYMLGAAIAAGPDTNKPDLYSTDYRAFLFMFANTILHEIGHIFLTFLTGGTKNTPPFMKNKGKGDIGPPVDKTRGESGHQLEQLVFGGTMSYPRDPFSGTPDKWCGTPYVYTEEGVYRITQATIDRTVKACEKPDEKYDFDFPYGHSEINEISVRRFPMGDGNPEEKPLNPLENPDWPKLQDSHLSSHR